MELFLARGVVLSKKDVQGDTVLHRAVLEGHDEIALMLVEHGADMHMKNPISLKSPFELASKLLQVRFLQIQQAP